MSLLDDFLWRAVIAGIGLALVAGPLGCFLVWRRMAYFGDTMAHSALLGVALGFLLNRMTGYSQTAPGIDITFGVIAVTVGVSFLLLLLQRQRRLSSDTLLGILSHGTLSIGLIAVALMSWLRIDLMGVLFGDILAVGMSDIAWIYGGGLAAMGLLAAIWRPLLAATVNEDLARAEGMPVLAVQIGFMLVIALVIAIAMKIVGVLLITSLMIIPAAAARRWSSSPEAMAGLAAVMGVTAVCLGITGSASFDTPSGPSIVVAALLMFFVSQIPAPFRRQRQSGQPQNPTA